MAEAERPIPIICGPTGAGKTSVALALADEFPIEIISADSRQIIRGLDIGTAKPTPEERAHVPFHLIDCIELGERYTAFRFIDEANAAIAGVISRGRQPVVVGGTGLYLRALTDGIVEIQEDDLSIREGLERELAEFGPIRMHERLMGIDPLEAARVHPNNTVRVIRALEIFALTGRTKSELAATGRYRKGEHRFACLCLIPPREELYDRINQRVDAMLAVGFVREVQRIVAGGQGESLRAANILGYNEVLDHLAGQVRLDEAAARIRQNHRRYAKRQMTWFRRQAGCTFFADAASILGAVRTVLARG